MLNLSVLQNSLKATIRSLIVALLFTVILFGMIYFPFKKSIHQVMDMVSLISQNTSKEILKDVKLDLTTRRLTEYPTIGTKYGSIKIASIGVDSPVYYGDSLKILRYGVGHSSGSYFPGEGASILYMGHLSTDFKNLQNIKNGDSIIVETNYGTFTYAVYKTDIIMFNEMDKVPIQTDKEILMVYTCDQLLTIGHTKKRFVVYAELVNAQFKEE